MSGALVVPLLERRSGRRKIPRRVQKRVPLSLLNPDEHAELLRAWASAPNDVRQRWIKRRMADPRLGAQDRRILREYLPALRKEHRDAEVRRRKERKKKDQSRAWKNWQCRRFGRKPRAWKLFVQTPFGAKFDSVVRGMTATLGALFGGRR